VNATKMHRRLGNRLTWSRWVIDYEPQEGRVWALTLRVGVFGYRVSFSWLGPPYTHNGLGINVTWHRYRV
jgi:hypothetical protein